MKNRKKNGEDICDFYEKFSILLISRKVQIKTTMSCHFTPNTMSPMKKVNSNKCRGCGETGDLTTAGGGKSSATALESSLTALQKVKHRVII
jgi:hypothetical protein